MYPFTVRIHNTPISSFLCVIARHITRTLLSSSKLIKLVDEVEHAEELIVNFDKVEEIEAVECSATSISVEFLTAADARAHGKQWIKGKNE